MVENVRTMFDAVDTDKSGYVEFSEFREMVERAFHRVVLVRPDILRVIIGVGGASPFRPWCLLRSKISRQYERFGIPLKTL